MAAIKKATTLVEALNVFDSRTPLKDETLKAFYVERPDESSLETLKVYLQALNKPGKFLFTGPRGSGKSTELNRLIETSGIRSRFFVVQFSVTDTLNPFDFNFIDLLLGIANQLLVTATDEAVLPKGVTKIIKEDLLDELYLWITRDLLQDIPFRSPNQDWELSAKVNFLAVELGGKLGNEPLTRQKVRERTELRLSQLLDNINYVIGSIRQRINRETLIIIEDIDKLDPELAGELYFQHAVSLAAPKAYIVYTFPIALRYTNDFSQIKRNFNDDITLPNIKVSNRDGTANAEGRSMLRKVLLERMNADLIEPEAIDLLVEMSGGVPVSLIALAQRAINQAIARKSAKVEVADVQPAIDKERGDFQGVLTQEHYTLLRQRASDKAIVNDAINRECLHNLSLLEYKNANPWRDVHPVVAPLLEDTKEKPTE